MFKSSGLKKRTTVRSKFRGRGYENGSYSIDPRASTVGSRISCSIFVRLRHSC